MTNTAVPGQPTEVNPLRRAMLWIVRAVTWLLHAYILLVEAILLLGFLLLLGGANPSSSFVQWAYRNLDRAMKPFRGIFEPIEIGTGGNDVPAVVDTSVLFAMIVYALVLVAVNALLQWLGDRAHRLDQQDADYQRYLVAQQRQAEMQYRAEAYAAQPPLTVPGQAPGATPTATPGQQAPGATPTATPSEAPGATPAATPGQAPGATPTAMPGQASGATPPPPATPS